MTLRLDWNKLAGVLLVLALHGAALWALWAHRLIPAPQEAAALFVDFIAPPTPAPEKAAQPQRAPQPRPIEPPRQLAVETPQPAPATVAAPPPPPPAAPRIEAPPLPLAQGPVTLNTELSVSCAERATPAYPALSRRLNETGVVLLRVELSESGQVAAASVSQSSGFARLDNAALGAVRNWRCAPATRNGQPVRAVALQPFNFVLQGN